MGLEIRPDQLRELMQAFYTLTGIKIAVFDTGYTEIAAYPEGHCAFCRRMQSLPATREFCMRSNASSFDRCRREGAMVVYHCHAGLVEATAPLKDGGVIIGYVMFGQIADSGEPEQTGRTLRAVCRQYGVYNSTMEDAFRSIAHKTPQQIQAAARILEACTLYVVFKEMVFRDKERFVQQFNRYIDQHMEEAITIEGLSDAFQLSRSKLYELSAQYLGCGIAAYIRRRRLERARELLRTTSLPITAVAGRVGFADYNYFCRVFKAATGLPAKRYRQRYRSEL